MKRAPILTTFIILALSLNSYAQIGQYPPFTKWYQNPLGFSPISLHTSSGLWIPAIAATACLIFTKDSTIADRISYFNEGGISYGYYASKTTVYQNNTGLLFHARKWMAIGGEITTYHVRDDVNNTWGFGIRPFFRFYPVHKEKIRVYFESGAGIIGFIDKFPQPSGFFGDFRTGTNFNGSPKYGVGTEVNIDKHFSLQCSIRHVHISNGNTWGKENNPGHDSNGFSIGFLYRPDKPRKRGL